jgi:hypothetical protein
VNVATKTVRAWRNVMFLAAPMTQSIPYRTDSAISGGTVAVAIVATVLVLAAFVGILMYGRQRGWIPAAASGRLSASTDGIQLHSSRRLSALATAHVIHYRGNAYLIVESARGSSTSISLIPQHSETLGAPDEAE